MPATQQYSFSASLQQILLRSSYSMLVALRHSISQVVVSEASYSSAKCCEAQLRYRRRSLRPRYFTVVPPEGQWCLRQVTVQLGLLRPTYSTIEVSKTSYSSTEDSLINYSSAVYSLDSYYSTEASESTSEEYFQQQLLRQEALRSSHSLARGSGAQLPHSSDL